MADGNGLVIRSDERADIRLPVRLQVDAADRSQVTFSRTSGALATDAIQGELTDISLGGMGVVTGQYLPRNCTVQVQIVEPGEGEAETVWLQSAARVRRIRMENHEPSYAVGISFINAPEDLAERVQAVLDRGSGDPSNA